MKLYIAVSRDIFELPIVVADSLRELAGICGVSPQIISVAINNGRRRKKNTGFVRIEVEEEEFVD